MKLQAIDLFCGVGGLTHGLQCAGIDVRLGVDLDPACEYPYKANNRSAFLLASVEKLGSHTLSSYLLGNAPLLLAGCAPCQPFSLLLQGGSSERLDSAQPGHPEQKC